MSNIRISLVAAVVLLAGARSVFGYSVNAFEDTDASWGYHAVPGTAYQPVDSLTDNLQSRMARLSPYELDEVVWLARCIYSESDRPHEQELVAWVVRNRVETQYRGTTYREVILEAKQFSAFNAPTPRRAHILNLTASSPYHPWRTALGIALDVYKASPNQRPFSKTVRHFYSPISMRAGRTPDWAETGEQLSSTRLGVDPFRFRFFDDVDEGVTASRGPSPITEREAGVSSEESGGFLLPMTKPSGRVARPRRPVVKPARNRQP